MEIISVPHIVWTFPMRSDYLQAAQSIIQDPMVLINIVSKRVKQLKFGERPLVTSFEKLEPEDVALREIIEGKLTFELYTKK
jgi:DNA-directed RNA polymerase subunit omega